jgi:outer membrane immunogenic protein
MKKLWLVAVAGLALSTSAAYAADLGQPYYKAPPPPPVAAPSWTGFYIGINGGYGWSKNSGDLFCENVTFCPEATGNILKPKGGLAGGQIGYNWQSGIVVYGIEADIQWADIHDSQSVETGFTDLNLDVSQKLDWFGTVRGRLGITPWSNTALLYVTGGLIYGGQKVSATLTDDATGAFASVSQTTTRAGGTVGLGLEYLFTPNLSGKVEGLWYDMGSRNLALVNPITGETNVDTTRFNMQGVIVRAGLNWHFNWGGNEPVATRY